MAPRDTRTLDLLSWEPRPPVPVVSEETVRAATLATRICRAMAQALKDAKDNGIDRDTIAQRMSDFLGETVSKDMLDKYAAESSTDHNISVVRFIALIHATTDMRLLQLVSEQFGHSVLPTEYVAAAEEAMLGARIEELERRRKLARRKWEGPR